MKGWLPPWRALLSGFALLLPPVGAQAQAAGALALQGRVLTSSGAPVSGAQVTVRTAGGATFDTRAGREGGFDFRTLPESAWYEVTAAGGGYAPASVRLIGVAALATPVDVVLSQRVLALAPVAVFGSGMRPLQGFAGATRIIDRSELQRHRPVATHDILRHVPGVHVQDEDGLGLHLNIGIRGLDPRRSSRVLLLEDGVPIHLGPYTDPSSHYQPPAEVIERVEVIRGAGQIAHGPQTAGGVINFVRRPPPDASGASLLLRLGNRGQVSGHGTAALAVGRHSTAVSLSRRQADGARRQSDHEVSDGSIQTLIAFGSPGTLLLKAGAYVERSSWGEAGLTQAEHEADPLANPSPNDVFELNRYTTQAVYERQIGIGRLTAVAYGHSLTRTSWRQANSSADRFGSGGYAANFRCPAGAAGMGDCGYQGRPRAYRFAGIEPRLLLDLDGAVVPATLEVGLRLHAERAERRQFVGPERSIQGADLTRDNVLTALASAGFVQARLQSGAFVFSPGLRLERVRSTNTNRISGQRLASTAARWLPGAGVSWDIGRATTFFAGAHRGFAPPRPADVLSPAPGAGLVQVDAEVSWNQEFGVRSQPLTWLDIETAVYRIDFRNQIVEGDRIGAGQRFVNAGSTLHRGVEVSIRAELRDAAAWRPFAAVGYTLAATAAFTSDEVSTVDGVTPVRGRRVPYAPRHALHTVAGLVGPAGIRLALRTYSLSAQYGDDLNTIQPSEDGQRGRIPGFTVLGATLNYPVRPGTASLFLTADNLANAVYITARQEGIMTGPPRRIAAGVEWLFE